MAGRGETVKYIIDADTSGFTRGMGESAVASEVAGRRIERSLNRTTKHTENNFTDIRRNASTAANQIRNFGIAFQAFNTTSWILGITAATGAILELSGAIAAAGSTISILAPIFAQGAAASTAFQAGVFGLSDAFKAVGKNDAKAFAESMVNLGPAARSVALSVAGLNKAFNSIRLNTQQALLQGVGNELLRLGAIILPTVNAGFQRIGASMSDVFKQASALAEQPVFSSLLATVFADTAHNVDIMSGALAPLLSIFTNLYLVTRSYVSLLAEQAVNSLKNVASYLSSAHGQEALNIAIQEGLIAIKELGNLAGAVFGLLTSIFATSVNSGVSLITTLTGIVNGMKDWVNSAKGQAQLIALFHFTSLAIATVADALGHALSFFFDIVQAVSSLNPQIQQLIVGFLASSLVIRPVISYLGQLYLAVRVLAVTLFNFAEQAIVVFTALGALTSVVLVLSVGLIALGAILKGPLGGALILIGAVVAAYIGLSFLLSKVTQAGAVSFWEQAFAAHAAAGAELELAGIQGLLASTMIGVAGAGFASGAGLGFAARAAQVLQASLGPLLVLAAGVLVILSMLGLFSSKGKEAQGTSLGLGNSLGALQKSMKGVGSTGNKAATKGITPLSDALNSVGDAANTAQGSLAAFDKMNVLTEKTALGAGAGIPNVPGLPDVGGLGGGALGAPPIDTTAFDASLADMQKNFEGLQKKFDVPFSNPFAAIGEFINANPIPFFVAFAAIVGIVVALFATGAVAIGLATLPLTLIVIGITALIAAVILLVKNWDAVWKTIQNVTSVAAGFIGNMFKGLASFIGGVLTGVGDFFKGVFDSIVSFVREWGPTILAVMFLPFSLLLGLIITFKDKIAAFFTGLWNIIVAIFTPIGAFFGTVFTTAWNGIVFAFSLYVGFWTGLYNGLANIFSPVVSLFANIFAGAWNAVKAAFSGVVGFFQGIWGSIVNIFGAVGTAVGNAIAGAVKSVINSIINTVSNIVNSVIDIINGAIGLINKLPGVHVGTVGRVTLPRLAKGGIITSPTVAEIGERGAEAVMPLENNTGWIDMLADKINSANGSNDGQPIQLTVQIGEDKVATKIIELINEKTQMSGRNAILI